VTDTLGVAAIVAGSALGVLTVLWLWRRIPASVAVLGAVLAGMLISAGALLVQDAPSAADWVVTMVVLGGLSPLHAKLMFGPPGAAK